MPMDTHSQPNDDLSREPLIRARELVAFWHVIWGPRERLNDVPLDPRWLAPWAADIAIFELVDHGADFRVHDMGSELGTFFGGTGTGAMLSEFSIPYRHRLRRVLLRAAIVRAPSARCYNWLIEGQVRSCIVCAMPIAGGFYRPSRLLLAIFHRTLEFRRRTAAEYLEPIHVASGDAPVALPRGFPSRVSAPALRLISDNRSPTPMDPDFVLRFRDIMTGLETDGEAGRPSPVATAHIAMGADQGVDIGTPIQSARIRQHPGMGAEKPGLMPQNMTLRFGSRMSGR